MTNPTEEVFLKDIANHEMKVLLNQGIYRHIRFRQPNNSNAWFEIVTWPGHLAYAGDMGSFVFARLEDMFEFFRTGTPPHGPLRINQSYWGEKLQAVDRDGRKSWHKRYSPDKMRAQVDEKVDEWITELRVPQGADKAEGLKLRADFASELREAIDDEICLDEDENEAHRTLRDFSFKFCGVTYRFYDTWEWDCDDYTYRFTWCCYAIAWAIRKYDAMPGKGGE